MPFNSTHLEHLFFALAMQAVFVAIGYWRRLPMPWWTGAAFASAWFISREHTQREYKLFTFGDRPDLSPFAGFQGWSLDAWLDAAIPTLAVLVAGVVYQRWLGKK